MVPDRSVRFLLGAAGFWLCAAAAGAAPGKAGAPIQAIVTRTEGEVLTSTAPGAAWTPAETGMKCGDKASIKTGAAGSAELMFEDGNAVRLDRNTLVSIESAARKKRVRETRLSLWAGRLLSNVAKLNKFGRASFQVKTPVAVAAVRGTVFVTEASSDTSRVAVFDGEVRTRTLDGGAEGRVSADQETSVRQGAGFSPAAPIAADMAAYRDTVAALFNARIETLRSHMEELERLHKEFMERRSGEYRREMEGREKGYRDAMKEFRKRNKIQDPPLEP